jgi:DNA-binding MarR family transcriptional regulator
MRPEETFDFRIRRCWIAMSKMYNELVSTSGITVSVGFALLNIDVKDGTPSTALGPKMGMESTSLSRLLKSMESSGLIFKEAHPDDKRSVLLKLTPLGLEKRDASRDAVLKFNAAISNSLGELESQSFFEAMDVIEHNIELMRSPVEIS